MAEKFLYDTIVEEFGRRTIQNTEIPDYLKDNLNPKFELRPYQEEAFARFFLCLEEDFDGKEKPLHLLFNMATGSGKTLIMAGLILYLYEKDYRNFLFFVNSTNIIEKTKDNFLNLLSSKYLFNDPIHFGSVRVDVTPVPNFEGVNENDINICFTTIQQLHIDLNTQKENALTFEDFKDKKIVLLADEAHHINTSTKAGQELIVSWENTVERIFGQNPDNLLLEFTATLDYTHRSLADKYRNKVLYKYDLRQFRNDGYSKDVFIVQADFEERDRIIQALILNQYKQEVAAKHQINLKPVILFKAQRTIEQSRKNKEDFHKLIDNLTAAHIANIRRSNIPLVQRAFQFFDDNDISDEHLVGRLKREFQEDYCLSVNDEQEKENYQILVNTLEDNDNRIRAIFAVQKLNEGWDVLNLFDIVRCYTTRDAKAGKPGKTTIAEAQLIGRGARYFPFATDDYPDQYQRKFDKNLMTELRVLEELHYHSINNPKYISEIRTALIDEGMLDERTVEKRLKLKREFKKTDFYKHGIIYINERVKNRNESVRSFADIGVASKSYHYSLATGRGVSEAVLDDSGEVQQIVEAGRRDVPVKEIPFHVVRTAIVRNSFFAFKSLKTYFPHIKSVREFIQAEEYLGGLSITLQGDERYLLSNETYLAAVTGLLNQIESELRQNVTEYKGTESFKPSNVNSIFTDKTLKLIEGSERADGDEQLLSDEDRKWYVFNANYGTREEKDFVRTLDAQIDELKEKYDGIYLVRNERHFKIYNFDDGQAFEPDFVLFLREKNGNTLIRQIFIEPKGKYLQKHEKWKEDFLKQIKEKFAGEVLVLKTRSGTQKHRPIGVPFYDNQDERQFRESLEPVL
ncbi:type III deoxyribonuclease [Candidatus Poribacteria bacterium]|nr:MAG: type III deoxyribonuclease [Candidatus Poribacteria bacterium]